MQEGGGRVVCGELMEIKWSFKLFAMSVWSMLKTFQLLDEGLDKLRADLSVPEGGWWNTFRYKSMVVFFLGFSLQGDNEVPMILVLLPRGWTMIRRSGQGFSLHRQKGTTVDMKFYFSLCQGVSEVRKSALTIITR